MRVPTVDREVAGIEQMVQNKLTSIATIRELDSKWSLAVRSGQIEYSKTAAKQLQRLYQHWLVGTKGLLEQIKSLESQGKVVLDSEAFRDAVGFCPAGINVDDTESSFRRLERGEGVLMTQESHGKIRHRRAS